ncbi:MAG: hypothetical protein PHH09_12430 [Methanoregulaceae archaeon]|nr:hypothetical protein [Methanoregulaceae archaeon]
MKIFDAKQPLALPRGSIRALVALGIMFLCGAMLLRSMEVPEWFVGLIILVVRDYFAERSQQKTS